MSLKETIYMNNYYLNNPLKFYVKPMIVRNFFFGMLEIIKIILGRMGILKWYFNERIVERPFFFTNLPDKMPLKILDVGCSDSLMPVELAMLGHKVYCNDLKGYPYKCNNLKYIQKDVLKLPFPENFFDVIACISTLEHIGLEGDYGAHVEERKDKLAMQKMRYFLKNKGLLILTTPFGTKKRFASTRIYDSKEIKWISEGFKIKKQKYYYYDGLNWKEASPEVLTEMTKDKKVAEIDTVAMFVLEKNN